jgi:hypothetical protein
VWSCFCLLFLPLLLLLQVEFPVLPGDRLLLRLADVDVSSGYYRLYVQDRAASPGSSTAAELSSSDLELQEGDQERDEGEGELEDELQDEVERALLSLEGELEQELQQQGTSSAAAAVGPEDDSDALSVASEAADGEDAGVTRSSLAWRAVAAASVVAQPDSPSSSSSSGDVMLLSESPVGSFSSSEGSSELRARW